MVTVCCFYRDATGYKMTLGKGRARRSCVKLNTIPVYGNGQLATEHGLLTTRPGRVWVWRLCRKITEVQEAGPGNPNVTLDPNIGGGRQKRGDFLGRLPGVASQCAGGARQPPANFLCPFRASQFARARKFVVAVGWLSGDNIVVGGDEGWGVWCERCGVVMLCVIAFSLTLTLTLSRWERGQPLDHCFNSQIAEQKAVAGSLTYLFCIQGCDVFIGHLHGMGVVKIDEFGGDGFGGDVDEDAADGFYFLGI